VFDERRGGFVEEGNLVQAHAWMHDSILVCPEAESYPPLVEKTWRRILTAKADVRNLASLASRSRHGVAPAGSGPGLRTYRSAADDDDVARHIAGP
jgi:hypothetical protein